MVGGGVDGVWGTGEMVIEEEELAVIPFAFISAFISPSNLETFSKPSSILAFESNIRFLS